MDKLLALLSHYSEIFKHAWAQRDSFTLEREGAELEFLPDRMEIEQTSFNPLLGRVALALVLMICIAILWSIIGKTDIVATANGRLVTQGYTKTIQALTRAKIKAIYVQNGDTVYKGQTLIQLDDSDSAAQISKLQMEIPLLSKKANSYKQLYSLGYVSEHDYFEKEQARLEAVSQLEQLKYVSSTMKIESPVDGIVSQLAIHTVGGVVSEGEQLMLVVPQSDQIFLEGYLENKDIGFVKEGQKVEVKLEAFPYTRYGIIEGKVASISSDSIEKRGEKPVKQKESDFDEKSQTSNNYQVRIALNQKSMDVDGKLVDLLPGMVATGEIRTGQRRLISYILSPLIENAKEAAHER